MDASLSQASPALRWYRICGLTVASEIELSGALPVPAAIDVDVSVRRGVAGMEGLRLNLPEGGAISVSEGRLIIIDVADDGLEKAAIFVLGSAMGTLLHQRGTTVLHGSAVARDGQALLFTGASGAGKSTLAAALCTRGHRFVADDVCAISSDRQEPAIHPDGRRLKLWEPSIARLDLADRRRARIAAFGEKFFMAPPESMAVSCPILAIYALCDAPEGTAVAFERLGSVDAMRVLDADSYRPDLRDLVRSHAERIAAAAALTRRIAIYRLVRPRDLAGIDRLVDAVEMHSTALALAA
ncbi:HPr kinase/phosphorylase [Sphingomonas sp.]|uniref:HPr kinase/phosphorylase n=1 Tax=Sphingomonas sp. TaxID=28214 RepID=UPI003BA9127C